MIDFNNASFLQLYPTNKDICGSTLKSILTNGEDNLFSYESVKEILVFTNKRIIIVQDNNDQDNLDEKKTFTSLPYNKIQAYSIDTAEYYGQKHNLELWFSGLGIVKMEFYRDKKVYEICRIISEHVL